MFDSLSCGCHPSFGIKCQMHAQPVQSVQRVTASGLWIYIQALERACWSRKWSDVKAARKALEKQIGKRPHDPSFPPQGKDV